MAYEYRAEAQTVQDKPVSLTILRALESITPGALVRADQAFDELTQGAVGSAGSREECPPVRGRTLDRLEQLVRSKPEFGIHASQLPAPRTQGTCPV